MAAVTLTRPLWWVARRSLRLLTGLILMALLLGLGAGTSEAAVPTGPPVAASSPVISSPATSSVTAPEVAEETAADLPPAVAESPTGFTAPAGAARAGDAPQTVEPTDVEGADTSAPVADRLPAGYAGPDRRSTALTTAEAVRPGGPGHALPTGSRAPPTR